MSKKKKSKAEKQVNSNDNIDKNSSVHLNDFDLRTEDANICGPMIYEGEIPVSITYYRNAWVIWVGKTYTGINHFNGFLYIEEVIRHPNKKKSLTSLYKAYNYGVQRYPEVRTIQRTIKRAIEATTEANKAIGKYLKKHIKIKKDFITYEP